MPPTEHPGDLETIAVLVDPLRRRLYQLVCRQAQPVSRDEAAAAAGISRGLAAFHLDKLVDAGLLRARFEAPPARVRRVGRRPKLYERADLEVAVTIPERRYHLVGEVLVDAIAQATPEESGLAAATRTAMARGVALGAEVRQQRRLGRIGPERALTMATEVVEGYGYQPYQLDQHTVGLRNCPFQRLARRAPEVVCAINRSLLGGLLRGLGDQRVQAVLAPRSDACCVQLHAPAPAR
jgi:predicted ArsR family transcriptional regulator